MLEYRTYCYMQNQKTGCTFVETFLRKFSGEPIISYRKHAVAVQASPGKFHFINVREPLALYRSLFAYGLDGKGTVFLRLTRLGHGALYAPGAAGFPDWLRFVLAPQNAPLLAPGYTSSIAAHAGLMTWRFLRLAVFGFEASAPGFASRQEMNAFVRRHFFMNAVLKQESLREGLAQLVQGDLAPRLTSVPEALAWIGETPRINASESLTDKDEVPVGADVMQQLFSHERLLYRNYYPDTAGFAQWRATKGD